MENDSYHPPDLHGQSLMENVTGKFLELFFIFLNLLSLSKTKTEKSMKTHETHCFLEVFYFCSLSECFLSRPYHHVFALQRQKIAQNPGDYYFYMNNEEESVSLWSVLDGKSLVLLQAPTMYSLAATIYLVHCNNDDSVSKNYPAQRIIISSWPTSPTTKQFWLRQP